MKYGLIGEHLPHSFSKEIHARLAPYEYILTELTPDEVGPFMERADFNAINVTIPYKQTVIPYLDHIDEHAKAVGAVNTIVKRDGKLYGYNTDFYGMSVLIERIGLSLKDKKVLILGTGGTCLTSIAVSNAMGAREVLIAGRSAKEGVISYDEVYANHTDAEVIINTTPCGMFPYPDGASHIAGCPIDISKFPKLCGTVDAVYNPLRTNFILNTEDRGLPCEGGLYMLVAQAVKACEYFLDTPLEEGILDRVFDEIRAEKENIVLTGMPGSGKSTVGLSLAETLGRPFIDTDTEIKKKCGCEISEIFEKQGEAGFREIETEVVREVAMTNGAVIATGGGAILRDDNVRALRRNGRLYFLNRALEALIPTDDRPLASTVEAIKRRFEERYDRYLATCDCEIKIDENIEHTVSSIRKDFHI